MRNFILLIALFFVTQWLLKKLRRANTRAPADAPGSARSTATGNTNTRARSGAASESAPPQLADPLIRCAQCGVHTPRSEAVVLAGERFCCADHARRYAARPTGRDAR